MSNFHSMSDSESEDELKNLPEAASPGPSGISPSAFNEASEMKSNGVKRAVPSDSDSDNDADDNGL